MTTTSINYAAAASVTLTLASLSTTNAGVNAGRQSTVVDNQTNLYDDIILGGKMAGPINGGWNITGYVAEYWLFGSYDGTNFPGGLGSSDANFTMTEGDLMTQMTLLYQIFYDFALENDGITTPLRTWGPVSMRYALGGRPIPLKWGIFFLTYDNLTSSLDSTSGNFETKYTGVKLTGI